MKKLITLSVVMIAISAQAMATQIDSVFTTESAFTDNYKITTQNVFLKWNANGYVEGQQGSNWFGYSLYTSNPSRTPNYSFKNASMALTFSHSHINTTPATTIVSNVSSETNVGVYARVLLGANNNANNLRLQLGWGLNVTNNALIGGSQLLLDLTGNVSSGDIFYHSALNNSGVLISSGFALQADTSYTIIFEQQQTLVNSELVNTFMVKITDGQGGLLLDTGWQHNNALNAAAGLPGAVGFGGSTNTANGPNKYYQFTVTAIPEAKESAALSVLGALVIAAYLSYRKKLISGRKA